MNFKEVSDPNHVSISEYNHEYKSTVIKTKAKVDLGERAFDIYVYDISAHLHHILVYDDAERNGAT